MSASNALTLSKEERICSKLLTDELFNGGNSHAMSAFPLRAVYMMQDCGDTDIKAKMLISVPKRHFKRAVKRNRVKRQVREAYRKNKQQILSKLELMPGKSIAIAFIWLDDKLYSSDDVEQRMKNLLCRISEKL